MRPLDAQQAIAAWERGRRRDDLSGQALALLSTAIPDLDRERFRTLTLGQRDALLMRLREITFGPQIHGAATCPKCGVRLEFSADTGSYDIDKALSAPIEPQTLVWNDYRVVFRAPTGEDLDLVRRAGQVAAGRLLLLDACLLEARRGETPVSAADLPEELVAAVGERMAELDDLAEIPFAIECGRCRHQWLVLLEVGALLWHEISLLAERLLEEVHRLASAYSWSEAEILGLSAARRQFYLEQIGSD